MKRIMLVLVLLSGSASGQQVHLKPVDLTQEGQVSNIRGGTRLDPSNWPFIVQTWADADDDEFGPACTGSLIHPNWVLTAAHCLEEEGIVVSDVRVLIPALTLPPGGGESYRPEWRRSGGRVILHPEYNAHFDGDNWLPDVGLIELRTPVSSSERAPIRVLSPEEELLFAPVGTTVTELGSDGPDNDTRYDLYWIDVTLRDWPDCHGGTHYRRWTSGEMLDRWGLCAGGPSKVGESGDSGGPYVIRLPDGSFGQMGVQHGTWELDTGTVNVLTRMSAVYDWIAQYVPLPTPIGKTSYLHFPLFVSGQSWTTEFVFMNPFETYDVEVELDFFNGQGNRVSPLSSGQSIFTVPARGTMSVELPGSRSRTLSSGSVVATSDGPIEGFARLKAGDRAWLGANGIAAMNPNESFRLAFQAMIGTEQTYVSVRNPSSEGWINVQMTLLSAGGDELTAKSGIYIAPNGRYLKGLHTVFPAYKTDLQQFTGTVIVESLNDAPISAGSFHVAGGDLSGVPELLDWKDAWIRIADAVGLDMTVGELLKILGVRD